MSKSLDPRPVERDPLDGIIVFASGGKNNTQNGGQSGEPITVLWPPPANGIIPSPPDTAVDECPPLVSSEDEETEWARNNDELVKRWMTLAKKKNRHKQEVEKTAKKKNLLEEEVQKIEVQGVGLYLLGMTTCAPTVWVSALMMAGVFDVTERERMVNVEALDDKLLLLSEVAEEIFRRNKHIFFPSHRKTMKAVLNMIDDIEKNGVSAEVIEVQRSLQIAMDCSFFNEEWQELRQTAKVQKYIKEYTRGDKQPPLFMLLFFYKLVHHHVSYFGSHKGTKADDIIRIIYNSNTFNYRTAKMEGNRYFKEKEYTEAIKMYSVSMIKDYGNPILYGNRAQCYIFIQEYWKAYCDCRRAIFLNPTWFKGYYRGAEACLHMDRLDEALELNKKAQSYCSQSDEGLQMDILKQKQKIIAALKARGGSNVDMEDYAAMESQVEAALARKKPQKEKMDFPPRDTSQKSAAQGNLNNNSRDKLKSKTESESSRGSQHLPRPQEMTSVEKFIQYVREALEAYNVQNPVRAAAKYESALDLYTKSAVVKTHVSDEEFTVLRYSFGINAVSQDRLKMMIREGHRMLQALYQEQSSHKTFPLVIYGLGMALVALHRFAEAKKVVDVPITKAMKKSWKEVCWPQSKQTIEESKRDVFLRELTRLKELCRFPPPPDAVCFKHVDHTESRSIYKDSPTFEVQGLVKLSCYEKCILTFHYATCWKEYRGRFSADKISDKDVVDKPCPTPDCGSFISSILIQKPDKRPVVLKSESRPTKPRGNHKVGRMSLSNPDKIARRAERKELKRQKRAKARQVASQENSPSHSVPEKEAGSLHDLWKAVDTPARSDEKTVTVMPSANAMVILQKEEEKDDIKYNPFHNKTRTNKKKKEKVNRNRLNLEVNFTDDAERERVGERDALGDDPEVDVQWSKPPRMALLPSPAPDLFAVPPHLKEKVVSEPFSKIVANMPSRNPVHSQREEEIRYTVIEFLADFLREAGPQHIEGPSMHQTLQDFPEESSRIIEQYGGIRSFLAKHSHFAVVGNYAGVREDLEKVRHLADGLYDPPPNFLSTNPYPYSADRPLTGGDSGAIARTLGSVRPVYSRTLNGHAGSGNRTSPSFVGPGKVAAETEMTLPRCDFGLNPTAPEFQPGQLQVQGRLGVNSFDTDDDADWNQCPSSDDRASGAQCSERLDALDTFTSGIDDIDDDETLQEWNRIDEGDINPSASDSYTDLDDLVAGQVAAGQDGLSRRSSRSDLSQTSDLSTSAAFRAASPSSSMSSHKTGSTRDLGSPFSLRDTSSPALPSHMARAGDVSRKTGSPISSSASVSSTSFVTTDRGSSGLGLGFISDRAALTPPTAAYSSSAEFDSVGPPETNWNSWGVHGVPRPLKPLAPVMGAGVRAGGVSVSMGSARAPTEGASTPMGSASVGTSALSQSTSSTFVKSTASPSVLRSSSSMSALAGGFSTSSYSFPLASSQTWGVAASVPASDAWATTAWATDSFPSAVRPDEDVVNSIPPFPTATFFPSSSSSSSTALPHLPSSSSSSSNHTALPSSAVRPQPTHFATTLPSFSHSAGSDAENWSGNCWSAVPLASEEAAKAKVVDSETQASVEVRSVEVSTEMSERDVQSLLMQQHKLDEMYHQLHHLHLVNERLQQENRKKEEEKQVVLEEVEELRKDLSKTIHQMDNLDMEFQRSKEERAERERQFHDDFRGLQEQNNLSAMETAGLLQKLSALEEKVMLEQNRAIQAEVRVIQEMMQNFKMKLESKIKEAELGRQHCTRLAHRWQEANPGQPLPEQYKEYMAYYQQLHDAWTNKMEDIMAQLLEQKEQILAGWLLADLAAITNLLPNLPQPPKGFMMGPNGQPLAPFMSPSGIAQQHTALHPALPAPESGQEPPTPAALATGAVQPRPVGPPGLSMPRPPTPLRPPLRHPGMPLAGRPSTAAPGVTPTVSKPQPAVAAEPAKSTPHPLRPISTGKSLPGASQPRIGTPPPLTAAPSQPLASLKAVAQAPDALRPPSSFERLVSHLQKTFPTCDREDFHRAIQELRCAHNGTLTGLSLEFILRHITQMLMARGMKPHNTALSANGNSNNSNNNNNNNYSIVSEGRRTAPPPGISVEWNVEGLADNDPFVEELDPCAICCEELSSGPVQVLDCGHRYHDKCIRTWFRQQTTCPECRTYTPLLDDFPKLK